MERKKANELSSFVSASNLGAIALQGGQVLVKNLITRILCLALSSLRAFC